MSEDRRKGSDQQQSTQRAPTDDGENYEYVWDAFYRLRKVNDTSDQSLVAEYVYNGLGYRISVHEDTDTDGDVDASDKWFHSAYDERWRVVGTFREDDSDPKEQFVYHTAGGGGYGSGSYIDLVVLRDKDANTAWTSASDGTLEERIFYCQNWRADVVALVDSSGQMLEWAKYSAYGVPFGMPGGDTDSDGDCDSTDVAQVRTWIDASAYDVRGDIDLDGDVDATDKSSIEGNYLGLSLGRGELTTDSIGNMKGWTGHGLGLAGYDIRERTHGIARGRWLSRDKAGYVDGISLYEAFRSAPLLHVDPTGNKALVGGVGTAGRGAMGGDDERPLEMFCRIPPCPPDPPGDGTNDGWCRDKLSPYHCGLECYRSYGTGTVGGQQCCYDSEGNLDTSDKCGGTIDRVGGAVGERDGGDCIIDPYKMWDHWDKDVCPFEGWTQGGLCHNTFQNCMKGNGIPMGAGATDEELNASWEECYEETTDSGNCPSNEHCNE